MAKRQIFWSATLCTGHRGHKSAGGSRYCGDLLVGAAHRKRITTFLSMYLRGAFQGPLKGSLIYIYIYIYIHIFHI